MKDIKCPLCDNKLVKRCAYDYESIVALTCLNCGYQILDEVDLNLVRNNEYNHALSISDYEAAERFVSKFPPIMRLKEGDNVMLYDRELCAVHSVNLKYNRVVLQNCRADIMVETADKIEKWPWELDRKEVSND